VKQGIGHEGGTRRGSLRGSAALRQAKPAAPTWRQPIARLQGWWHKRALHAKLHADARIVRESGLFDADWYIKRYPDVAATRTDPVLHYLEFGASEKRDPSGAFDTRAYLKNYPDVAASATNPLLHYIQHGRLEGRSAAKETYDAWSQAFDTLDDADRAHFRAAIERFPAHPRISVLMPVYNTESAWLERAIASVRAQLYPHWELCISDDASPGPHVREILERHAALDARIRVAYRAVNGHISANSNGALALASCDYVALMDDDDELTEHALFWMAREILEHPDADLIYSDEDKIDQNGELFSAYFKPDWNPAMILSQNCFSHLGVYRRSLIERAGGFRVGFEGSQDHDLVLRCADLTAPQRIRHVPRILYHWRARAGSTASSATEKPYAWAAGARAIQESLDRRGIRGRVGRAAGSLYQVDYQPGEKPRVAIVILSTCKRELIEPCVQGLLELTRYPDFELLVATHAGALAAGETAAWLKALQGDARVRVLAYPDRPFNYSWANNWAAAQSAAPVICFMNDDIEVVAEDWLDKLVARVALDRVGAAGPMLYYPDDTIQHAGVILGVHGVAGHQFRRQLKGTFGYFGRAAVEQDLSCVTAACMVVRRSAFTAVGGFNEALPIAFNDVDLCLRLRAAGWRIIWTPAVELYHHESASLGHHDAPERRAQFERDVAKMRADWGEVLDCDPFFNPNLSLDSSDYDLAFPPRRAKLPPLDVTAHGARQAVAS
jgi:GT2 family glycosyltransferase